MPPTSAPTTRRLALRRVGGLLTAPVLAALAPRATAAPATPGPRTLRVAQLVDVSAEQQEISRDYAAGVQLAIAEAGRGSARTLQVVRIDVDGSDASIADALRDIRKDDSLLALVGTVGERAALSAIQQSGAAGLDIAHVGPWLADPRFDTGGAVFPIFASRGTQIEHALRSLAGVGVAELGVVHADRRSAALLGPAIEATAAQLRLRVAAFTAPPGVELARFAGRLPETAPQLLLFVGGAVELAQFAQGLAREGRGRYVICLADVDVTSLMQLGAAGAVPLIVTQVVPNPQTSVLPVVMNYRARLKELFDEAPSALSLAGYLVGRYALQTLAGLDPAIGRAGVIAELKRRPLVDLGGYRVDFSRRGRGSDFVSQTLLRSDGRLLG